jgi:hypothetical protein
MFQKEGICRKNHGYRGKYLFLLHPVDSAPFIPAPVGGLE